MPDEREESGDTRRARAWIPTTAMMLVSLVSYVDRNTLALLAPTVLDELHLSAQQYGWAIAAFSIAYTIGNPAWGALLDRVGLRAGMIAAVTLWTAASASHALVGGLAGLVAARALLGFGEGATFPGGLRAATQSLPAHLRSRGVALAYSGGSLGAIATPILVTPIAVRYGWRGAFVATGILGVAWIVLWSALSRTSRDRAGAAASHDASPAPLDARVAAFVALYALGGVPLGIVLYGAPLYLARALHLSQKAIGDVVWLPPLGWEVGYFFWGWIADARARRGARDPVPPAIAILLATLALPLAAVRALPGVAFPVAVFVLATFAAAGFIILGLSYATRAFGTSRSALLAGIGAGSWSAFVALLMPIFGRLFDRGEHGAAFALCAGAPLAGTILYAALARATNRS